jgi:hypothetical protein
MTPRRFLSVLAAFSIAMGLVGAAVQPSFAEDDDEHEPTFLQKVFGSVGLLALPGPQLDMQERAPLVVPPVTTYVQPQVQPNSAASESSPWDFNNPRQAHLPAPDTAPPAPNAIVLPPPVEPNSARTRNPDFPLDPEVKAAQKNKKKKRMFSRAEDDPSYSGRTLTPNEMKGTGPLTRGTKGASAATTDNDAQGSTDELKVPLIGNIIRGVTKKQQAERLEFTGEPERQSLTQPPSGYLTPAANAPYGTVTNDRTKDRTPIVHPNMPDAPFPTEAQ